MKLKLIIVAVLFISGCSQSGSLYPADIEWANKVCEANGGVKRLKTFHLFSPDVECMNGALFMGSTADPKV